MKLVRHTVHSSLLIPRKVVEEAKELKDKEQMIEHIRLWIDAHQSNHFLRAGDEVYHKGNLNDLLYVDKVIRKVYGEKQAKRSKIIGVEVHFWEDHPDDIFI